MSVGVMSLVFRAKLENIRVENKTVTAPLLKLVLLALADCSNDSGESAYPGLTTIEHKTALTRKSVVNTIDALKHQGLIIRAGLSRRGTSNYTLNVAMLKSLVPVPDIPLFTGVPGTPPKMTSEPDPAAGVPGSEAGVPGSPDSSFNHPLNTLTPQLSEADQEQVDRKVDYILENERRALASWKGRENLPEPIRELLDAFVRLSGLKPSKRDLTRWLQVADEWLEKQITVEDVEAAWHLSQDPNPRNGFLVGGPDGLFTIKAAALSAQRRRQPAHDRSSIARTQEHLAQRQAEDARAVPPPAEVLDRIRGLVGGKAVEQLTIKQRQEREAERQRSLVKAGQV